MTGREGGVALEVVNNGQRTRLVGALAGEAAGVPVQVRDDELVPSPLERRFAEEYFDGEWAHNGTRSYMAASPTANFNTASVEASRLLRRPSVQNYLRELHDRATEAFAGELKAWAEFLPLCQRILVATAEGRLKNRLAFEAAVYITNRAAGQPVANVDLHVINQQRIAGAVKAFMTRVAQLRVE